jgi:uncharacterized protein YdeI (YjbR/CyaY-like superfamily)
MVLKRDINPMPSEVKAALERRGLTAAFASRPDYQRNDYLGWIARAQLAQTKQRRLDQMLDELDRGDVYMNMHWNGGG